MLEVEFPFMQTANSRVIVMEYKITMKTLFVH